MQARHTNQSINKYEKGVEIVASRFLSFTGLLPCLLQKKCFYFSVNADEALKTASKWVLKVSDMFCLICQRYK